MSFNADDPPPLLQMTPKLQMVPLNLPKRKKKQAKENICFRHYCCYHALTYPGSTWIEHYLISQLSLFYHSGTIVFAIRQCAVCVNSKKKRRIEKWRPRQKRKSATTQTELMHTKPPVKANTPLPAFNAHFVIYVRPDDTFLCGACSGDRACVSGVLRHSERAHHRGDWHS